jgi:hypothetical protein
MRWREGSHLYPQLCELQLRRVVDADQWDYAQRGVAFVEFIIISRLRGQPIRSIVLQYVPRTPCRPQLAGPVYLQVRHTAPSKRASPTLTSSKQTRALAHKYRSCHSNMARTQLSK